MQGQDAPHKWEDASDITVQVRLSHWEGGMNKDAASSRYLSTCFEYDVEETVGWVKVSPPSLYSGKLVGREALLGIIVFFRNGRVNKEVTSCCPEFWFH